MLAVGKELLIGRTLNTNAYWIGKRIARMGSMLNQVTTIDDDLSEIGAAFKEIMGRSPDFLVIVGGLGPTPDDMTLRGVAGALGVELRRSEAALRLIKEHYAKRGLESIELTPARVKMSRLPKGSAPVENRNGTAPGVRLVAGKTIVFCLPGVPVEMRGIFRNSVEPEVRERVGKVYRKYFRFKLEGVLESALAPVISQELRKHPGAYIKSHPRGIREGVSRIELDIAVVGTDERLTEATGEAIVGGMTDVIVGMGGRIKSAAGPGGSRR